MRIDEISLKPGSFANLMPSQWPEDRILKFIEKNVL